MSSKEVSEVSVVSSKSKLQCKKCGKVGSLSTMARHIPKCDKGKLEELKEKQRVAQCKHNATPKAKTKRKMKTFKEDLEEEAKRSLGGCPKVKAGFFDVQEWHPLYWDKALLPEEKCPVEFRKYLKDLVMDYTSGFHEDLSWMSEYHCRDTGAGCKASRKKITFFLHPDKVKLKNKDWQVAANYFNLKIKTFGTMLESGMTHIREGVSCSNCTVSGFCNKGMVDMSGDIKGMSIVEANIYVHEETVKGASEKLVDVTA